MKVSYHESDRKWSRSFHHSGPDGLLARYNCAVTKRAELVAASKPLIEALCMEGVRATQASYLSVFVELVETDRTARNILADDYSYAKVYSPDWIRCQQRVGMLLFLCSQPVVKMLRLDVALELLSPLLHSLLLPSCFRIMTKSRKKICSMAASTL